jgi:hypothetical protein
MDEASLSVDNGFISFRILYVLLPLFAGKSLSSCIFLNYMFSVAGRAVQRCRMPHVSGNGRSMFHR